MSIMSWFGRVKEIHRKKGSLRQTVDVLRQATTPAIIIRAFKTGRQVTGASAIGTGIVTTINQPTNKPSLFVSLLTIVLSFLASLWGNILTAAEKLVNDEPTKEMESSTPTGTISGTVSTLPSTLQEPKSPTTSAS